MNLYKNKTFQLSFLYILFFAVSISEYKFFYSSTIPVFLLGLVGIFFFYKNLRFTINEILIYSFFGVYISINFYFFSDLLIYLKSFKYFFGWIFFIFLFKAFNVNISSKNCFYFLFFLFLLEFVLVNFLKVSYISIYSGTFPSFRFFDEFFRVSGFTGNSSITTSIFSALYLSIILNNRIKISEFIIYVIIILLSYSHLGFIFLLTNLFVLIYKLKFFNKINLALLISFVITVFILFFNNLDISLGNKYRSGPIKYFNEIKDIKISQVNRHIGSLMNEDKEFNQVNSFYFDYFKYGDSKLNHSIEYLGYILEDDNQPNLINDIYFIDNPNSSYVDLLFGIQRKMNIFLTGGDFAILNQIISLGVFSLIIMFIFLRYYKVHLNLPAIILVASCIHYPTLMHISGQFFLAVLLNNNKLIKKYD